MKLDIWLGKVANLVKTSCMFLVLSVSDIMHDMRSIIDHTRGVSLCNIALSELMTMITNDTNTYIYMISVCYILHMLLL